MTALIKMKTFLCGILLILPINSVFALMGKVTVINKDGTGFITPEPPSNKMIKLQYSFSINSDDLKNLKVGDFVEYEVDDDSLRAKDVRRFN